MTTPQMAFAERCAAVAADLALFFVGAPEEEMLVSIWQVAAKLEAELLPAFGPDVAAAIAGAFVGAVAGHRRKLEAAVAIPSAMN